MTVYCIKNVGGQVKYIGSTSKHIEHRLNEHLQPSQQGNSPKKAQWLMDNKDLSIVPLIEGITDEKQCDYHESKIIKALFAGGFDLINNPKNTMRKRAVYQYDLNDNFIRSYDSLSDVRRAGYVIYKAKKVCIDLSLTLLRRSFKQYKWLGVEDFFDSFPHCQENLRSALFKVGLV